MRQHSRLARDRNRSSEAALIDGPWPVLMMHHNKQTYPVHVRLVFVAPRLALASSFQAEKNQSSPKPDGGFARPGRMAMSSLQAVTLPRCPCAPAVAFKLPAAQPMKPLQLQFAIFPPVKWKEAMHRHVALGRPTAVLSLNDWLAECCSCAFGVVELLRVISAVIILPLHCKSLFEISQRKIKNWT